MRWALLLTALIAATTMAQAPTRVRGEVAAMDGNALTVKAPGGNVEVQLGDKTELLFMQPIALDDIKPGDFLAITSTKRPDGTLSATDVRRFAKPVSPGHRPLDGRDDQTMTNASVGHSVQAASGRELTMTYEGGSQKIIVPPDAYLSMLVPGQRAQIVPGTIVSIAAVPGADGKLAARQIQFRTP
jgi:hypothetical protein